MADKPLSAEQLQNEYDEIITTVCSKRKAYSAACASILSKTLKIENSLLMNPNIVLRVKPKPQLSCRLQTKRAEKMFKELIAGVLASEATEFTLPASVRAAAEKQKDVRIALKQIQNTSEDKVAKHLD